MAGMCWHKSLCLHIVGCVECGTKAHSGQLSGEASFKAWKLSARADQEPSALILIVFFADVAHAPVQAV